MIRRLPALRWSAALFFILLAVTLAVAALVVRARTPDLVLEVTEIEPRELYLDAVGDPPETRISFFVREADPAAEVAIVNWANRPVRTLAAPVGLEADRRMIYRWDGRTDAGRRAMSGRYRLRVVLPNRDREMIWPRRITVHRMPSNPDGGSAVTP